MTFFIPGIPKATQTGTVVRVNGRAIPIRRNTSWSSLCGLVARQYAPPEPLTGPLHVRLLFWLPRPKTGKRLYPTVRPDAENLVKGLLDAWNGVLWQDDNQIVQLFIEKAYTPTIAQGPGVTVIVMRP